MPSVLLVSEPNYGKYWEMNIFVLNSHKTKQNSYLPMWHHIELRVLFSFKIIICVIILIILISKFFLQNELSETLPISMSE